MALVPAANGVDSITAREGVRIIDTGGGRFTIGLDIGIAQAAVGDIFDAAPSPGLSTFNIGPTIEFNYAGSYLLTCILSIGSEEGAITAGPDDRIVFGLEKADGGEVFYMPFNVYNRDEADDDRQISQFSSLATVDTDVSYQPVILIYNVSGTLDAPSGTVAYGFAPLTSRQPSEPAPTRRAPIKVNLTRK